MSSVGHILDMITRIRNNEAFGKMIRARYKEMKEQYTKHTSRHLEFIDRPKLSESEMKKLRKNIRLTIIKERKIFPPALPDLCNPEVIKEMQKHALRCTMFNNCV